jgi:CheY-like chemotaxis protein
MNILLIEDIAFSRRVAETQLKDLGHLIVSVEDGDGALEVLQSGQSIDLVICDLYLSGMDGFQVYKECENLACFKKRGRMPPPFILLTSSKNPRDLHAAEEMGFWAALPKPLNITQLQEIITSISEGNAFLQQSQQTKGKILLIDSIGKITAIMQDILQNSHYTLMVATSGEEGLQYVQEYRNIQLIVSDLELKDTNAITLLQGCRELQTETPGKAPCPFLLITESQDMDLLQVAHLSDFADIILPPLDKYIIKQRLNRLFMAEGNLRQENRSILLVDDIHFHCVMTKSVLHQHPLIRQGKINIITAGSRDEALDLLRRDPSIRLVITDYSMPGMNGLDVYHTIRAAFQKSSELTGHAATLPPFILLSVSVDECLQAKALCDGFRYVFRKPVEAKPFQEVVIRLLDLAGSDSVSEKPSGTRLA